MCALLYIYDDIHLFDSLTAICGPQSTVFSLLSKKESLCTLAELIVTFLHHWFAFCPPPIWPPFSVSVTVHDPFGYGIRFDSHLIFKKTADQNLNEVLIRSKFVCSRLDAECTNANYSCKTYTSSLDALNKWTKDLVFNDPAIICLSIQMKSAAPAFLTHGRSPFLELYRRQTQTACVSIYNCVWYRGTRVMWSD